jgi:hypothetical protein
MSFICIGFITDPRTVMGCLDARVSRVATCPESESTRVSSTFQH